MLMTSTDSRAWRRRTGSGAELFVTAALAVASGCALIPGVERDAWVRGVAAADGGRDREAIVHFTEFLEQHPARAEVALARGSAHERLGDRRGALADYTSALRSDPGLLPAYVARAALHEAMGLGDLARSDWAAVRSLAGDDRVR